MRKRADGLSVHVLRLYNASVNFPAIFVPRLIGLSLWALMGCLVSPAWAERADRDKPMNIESDRLDHDEKKQQSVFLGRVVLTKGTLILKGERIEVREDPKGYQYGVVTPAPGAKAFFRQKREGVNEWMEGDADRIEYDGKADVVTLIRNARMRRLVGTRLSDEFTGDRIQYDNPKDQFTIASQPGGAAKPGSPPAPRVRAVLTPKRQGEP